MSCVSQSRLTFCDPVDCSLPGSSVHGIFQGRNIAVGCEIDKDLDKIYPRCWHEGFFSSSSLFHNAKVEKIKRLLTMFYLQIGDQTQIMGTRRKLNRVALSKAKQIGELFVIVSVYSLRREISPNMTSVFANQESSFSKASSCITLDHYNPKDELDRKGMLTSWRTRNSKIHSQGIMSLLSKICFTKVLC